MTTITFDEEFGIESQESGRQCFDKLFIRCKLAKLFEDELFLAPRARERQICGLNYQQGFVDQSNIVSPPEIAIRGPFQAVFESDSSVSGRGKG